MDTSEGRAALQEDLDRLEEWANRNLMKFSKYKCKALPSWSSVERDLGVLVDNRLDRREQCAAAAAKKANGTRIASAQTSPAERKQSLSHSAHCLSGHTCNTRSVLVPAKQNRCGQAGEGPEKGHEDGPGPRRWSKDWEACHMKKAWENWVCAALTKEGLGESVSPCSSI